MTWFVATCVGGQELKALEGLKEAGVEVYVPLETLWRMWRRRRVSTSRAVIPGYVFVQTRRFDLVKAVDGVTGLVGFPEPLAMGPASTAQLEAIMEAEALGLFDHTRQKSGAAFKSGQQVRILRGPFAGLIADIRRFRGKRRAIVLMKALTPTPQKEVSVDLANLEIA